MSEVKQKDFVSQFDFTCEACGKKCSTGDAIHDVGNGVWCVDPNCKGGAPAEAASSTPGQPAQAQSDPPQAAAPPVPPQSIDATHFNEWLKIHSSVWKAAVELAEAADPDGDHRGKLIMAQVFYKTGFGYITAKL